MKKGVGSKALAQRGCLFLGAGIEPGDRVVGGVSGCIECHPGFADTGDSHRNNLLWGVELSSQLVQSHLCLCPQLCWIVVCPTRVRVSGRCRNTGFGNNLSRARERNRFDLGCSQVDPHQQGISIHVGFHTVYSMFVLWHSIFCNIRYCPQICKSVFGLRIVSSREFVV